MDVIGSAKGVKIGFPVPCLIPPDFYPEEIG